MARTKQTARRSCGRPNRLTLHMKRSKEQVDKPTERSVQEEKLPNLHLKQFAKWAETHTRPQVIERPILKLLYRLFVLHTRMEEFGEDDYYSGSGIDIADDLHRSLWISTGLAMKRIKHCSTGAACPEKSDANFNCSACRRDFCKACNSTHQCGTTDEQPVAESAEDFEFDLEEEEEENSKDGSSMFELVEHQSTPPPSPVKQEDEELQKNKYGPDENGEFHTPDTPVTYIEDDVVSTTIASVSKCLDHVVEAHYSRKPCYKCGRSFNILEKGYQCQPISDYDLRMTCPNHVCGDCAQQDPESEVCSDYCFKFGEYMKKVQQVFDVRGRIPEDDS